MEKETRRRYGRKQAVKICGEMALYFARQFGYDKIMYAEHTLGVWDCADVVGKAGAMSEYLAEKYGKGVLQDTYFYSSKEDDSVENFTPKNYVEIRYRFSNPCIAIHENGNQYMGELQLGPSYPCDENGCYIKDENGLIGDADESDYQISEIIAFHEKGYELANMLFKEWKRRTT